MKQKKTREKPFAPPDGPGLVERLETPFVAVCFFLSGIAGLVYEVLWVKIIGRVVGSTPLAVATILTVFMAGLALGSYLASRWVDKVARRGDLLWIYGLLECGVGLCGLVLPAVVRSVEPVYGLLYHRLFDHFWLYSLCSFAVCGLLLMLPVLMMGATLPVMSRFFVPRMSRLGRRVGFLYGINTAGAAVGVILAGFFMIDRLGVWGTTVAVASVNLLVGGVCAALGKTAFRKPDSPGQAQAAAAARTETGVGAVHPPRHIRYALAVFALSGFCAMAYQVIWARLIGLLIAPTTYAFSLVVGTFIIGLAIGNVVFGWLADRVKSPISLLAVTQMAAAVFALAASQLLGGSQFFFSKLLYTFQGRFAMGMLAQFLVLFFILFGCTLFLGATFPLVNKVYATALSGLGRSIGRAYALNTLGAVLGSFVGGFVLIPFLGKETGLKLLFTLQMTGSCVLLGIVLKGGVGRPRHWAALTLVAAVSLWSVRHFPDWDRQLLSYGRYQNLADLTGDFNRTGWMAALWRGRQVLQGYQHGREVVFYGDGIGGFTTVERHTDSMGTIRYTLLNSGKPDATSHDDAATQALLAHIPLLFHPDPSRVMILGLGSGMTAGEVLHYPVSQVDVLEINDQVIRASRFFEDWNNRFAEDPRTRIIVQDGRTHLTLGRGTYDVIISEPSNPWMAGMANLYTLESFRTVRERLRPDGIFIQWVNAGRMDWETLAMIGRTFGEVFPDGVMMVSPIGGADFFFVGTKGSNGLRLSVAEKNLDFAARSRIMRLADARLLFHLIISEALGRTFADGRLHTDDRPRLEFAAPRAVYAAGGDIAERLRQGRRVSQATARVVQGSGDLDMALNLSELAVSLFAITFPEVDLSTANPAQLERYRGLVSDFCAKRVIQDYMVFDDDRSREICADVQARTIQGHLSRSHGDGAAWGDLGAVYARRGQWDEAEDALNRYLVGSPEAPNAHFRLGLLEVMRKRYDRARSHFQETLNLNPAHAQALLFLARMDLMAGDGPAAVDRLIRVLELGEDPEARQLLRRIQQGEAPAFVPEPAEKDR